MLSKKLKRPMLAIDIRGGKPGAPKPGQLDDMHDDLGASDEDEKGMHDGDMMPPGGGAGGDAPESSGMESLFGGPGGSDHGDGDDESDDDDSDESDGDGGDSEELSPKEMEETSLADATPEQLQSALAAALAKQKSRGGPGGSDDDDSGGGDSFGSGSYT